MLVSVTSAVDHYASQVEIEYFLALMATLPMGQDLPSTAQAQLREIPAKLTLENAQVRNRSTRENDGRNAGKSMEHPWNIHEKW